MRGRYALYLTVCILLAVAAPLEAVAPTKDELRTAREWVTRHLGKTEGYRPYSFVYDGKPSRDLLGSWRSDRTIVKLDRNRVQTVQTYIDKATGLMMRCVMVEYRDYPAVEWTLWFKNTGDKDTPVLELIRCIDMRLERGHDGEFVLNGINGDRCAPESYQPYAVTLGPGVEKTFSAAGGWGTCGDYPFYNLQMPGGGLILVIGWPGQWSSSFTRDDKTGLRITGGQSLIRTYLKPGEEIRSPLTALVFWKGSDRLRAQNLWRGWMIDHNMPRTADGKLTPPLFIGNNQLHIGMIGVTEQNQKDGIDLYTKRGIEMDVWNIDAGWFECAGDWWLSGTWEADKARFPNGLKPVSDYLHSKGIKFMNWFEPERVGSMDSWLGKNHPEWLTPGDWGSWLLNLGDPAARQWVLEHIDKKIGEHGIDVYRQDFNMPPLSAWQSRDSADRQGITENLHIQGYLWWWDELRKRRPNLLMDSCASGGRRNDLETLRRAVPVLRTDYGSEPMSQQSHHYGISQWVPYHGAGYCIGKVVTPPPDCPPFPVPDAVNHYYFRSSMSPAFGIAVDLRRDDYDYDYLRRLMAQYKQVRKYFISDFYPLTEHSLTRDTWMAWQYYREDLGEGMVQAFRRELNEEPTRTFRLHGLDPDAYYEVKNIDGGIPTKLSGKSLMENGLTITARRKQSAMIFTYGKIADGG